MPVTFETLEKDEQVRAYIKAGNDTLKVIGYTEHYFPHLIKTAQTAASLLLKLGYPERTAELAKIAGLLHDIGNMINRTLHALTGAEIARSILERYNMPYEDIGVICGAIGNHDEQTGKPVNAVTAALVIADKSDVRRSRVQADGIEEIQKDIHDRVNFAVTKSELNAARNDDGAFICLNLEIDSSFTPVADYFEIFLTRMLMCRRAAEFLKADFNLIINDLKIM